ncbi:ddb1 and cul4 associated factor 7 [Homalodisca vitripennis]|nr:ddb1 and cul4 associated factor 7 [Homalodisca vitripennis]
MNWSVRPDKRFRLALGSFVEEYNNKVLIVSLDEDTSDFSPKSTFDHPYPTTKIMWIPDSKGVFPDLLATSGDYLRVWRAGEPETRLECVLNNYRVTLNIKNRQKHLRFNQTVIESYYIKLRFTVCEQGKKHWARHAAAGPNGGTMTTSGRKSDVHIGGFSLDNGTDVVIASPKPLYLDYDSDIIPATPEPCSRVIVPTSRIPQQVVVPSERIPSQLNILVYNSERYDVAHHCCSCGR